MISYHHRRSIFHYMSYLNSSHQIHSCRHDDRNNIPTYLYHYYRDISFRINNTKNYDPTIHHPKVGSALVLALMVHTELAY